MPPIHSFVQLASVAAIVAGDFPALLVNSAQEGGVLIDGQPIAASKQAGSSL